MRCSRVEKSPESARSVAQLQRDLPLWLAGEDQVLGSGRAALGEGLESIAAGREWADGVAASAGSLPLVADARRGAEARDLAAALVDHAQSEPNRGARAVVCSHGEPRC